MRMLWVSPCANEEDEGGDLLATATWTGGVFDRESLCFSLAVAVCGGGETVKAVEEPTLFLVVAVVVGGEPERETMRVVRCSSNTPSSSSSSKLLKSGSIHTREDIKGHLGYSSSYTCIVSLNYYTKNAHLRPQLLVRENVPGTPYLRHS